MDKLAIVQGLQPVQHLDEIRPAGLLGYFCRFARLRCRNLLQQVPIVRVFHHDAKSRSAVLHKALFVGDDVRMPISGDEKSTYENWVRRHAFFF